MTLIEIIPEQFLEPVCIGLTESVKNRLALGNHLIQIRILCKISPVVVLTISISGRFRIFKSAFQFKFLVCLHHLHTAPSSESDTSIEIICHHSISIGTSDRSDLKHTVGRLRTIKCTGHSILENLDIRNIQWIERHESIRRDHLSIKHIQWFIRHITLSE